MENKKGKANLDIKSMCKTLVNAVIKPVQALKEMKVTTESAFITAAVVSFASMLFGLIGKIIASLKVTKYSLFKGATTEWGLHLDQIKWLDSTIYAVLITFVSILVISGIFYLAGLVVKKEVKFTKLLTIVSISYIPAIPVSIVSAILGLMSVHMAAIVSIVASIYAFVIMNSMLQKEYALEEEKGIYFFTVCYGIIVIIAYIIAICMASSILGNLGSTLSILK